MVPPDLVGFQEMTGGVDIAGVVDQHVEAAEAGENLVEHGVDGGFGGDVGRYGQRIRADGRRYFGCALGGDIVDGDTRSLGGEAFGDGAAYAVPRAGHDYHLIEETLRLRAHVLRC